MESLIHVEIELNFGQEGWSPLFSCNIPAQLAPTVWLHAAEKDRYQDTFVATRITMTSGKQDDETYMDELELAEALDSAW